MAANTTPIFARQPSVQWSGSMTSANTDTSMATGTSYLVFSADATNGSKVEQVNLWHLGTNNSATVVRFFVNNGNSTGTAANNALVYEFTMAANTVSQTAASVPQFWAANLYLKPGYKLYATLGTAASAGIVAVAQGGDY